MFGFLSPDTEGLERLIEDDTCLRSSGAASIRNGKRMVRFVDAVQEKSKILDQLTLPDDFDEHNMRQTLLAYNRLLRDLFILAKEYARQIQRLHSDFKRKSDAPLKMSVKNLKKIREEFSSVNDSFAEAVHDCHAMFGRQCGVPVHQGNIDTGFENRPLICVARRCKGDADDYIMRKCKALDDRIETYTSDLRSWHDFNASACQGDMSMIKCRAVRAKISDLEKSRERGVFDSSRLLWLIRPEVHTSTAKRVVLGFW